MSTQSKTVLKNYFLFKSTPMDVNFADLIDSLQLADVIDIRDKGAALDGATADDTALDDAIAAAIASGGKAVYIPPSANGCLLKATHTLSSSHTKIVGNNSKIVFAPDHANGVLFDVTAADDIEVSGLWIDATGKGTSTTFSRYAIRVPGTSGAHKTNVRLHHNRFTNLGYVNSGSGYATHAIYASYVDKFELSNNIIDAPSGAGALLAFCTRGLIDGNTIDNTGWYSICLQRGCSNIRVVNNTIGGTNSGIRNWGGSINLMSDSITLARDLTCRNSNIVVEDNHFSGAHSYSEVIAVESCSQISITNNLFESCTKSGSGGDLTMVRIYSRGVASGTPWNNNSSDHVSVTGNIMVAGQAEQKGIYADAQDYGASTGVSPATDFDFSDNQIISLDDTHYFTCGVVCHGQQGGINRVTIHANNISAQPHGSPLIGAIALAGTSGKLCQNVSITENHLVAIGTSTGTGTDVGIGIDAYADHIEAHDNTIDGFRYGFRNFTNSGTDQRNYTENLFNNIAVSNLDLTVALSRAKYVGSYDSYHPTIAGNGTTYQDVTVTGAAVGDFVIVQFPLLVSGSPSGRIQITGQVISANTVRVFLTNGESSSITLDSGTIKVVVIRR